MNGTEYAPCSCIRLLHEQKKAYQPNMLRAIALTAVACALFAFCLMYFTSPNQSDILQMTDAPSGEHGTGTTAAKARAVGLDFRPPEYHEHEGFAGFRGYRLVPASVTIPPETSPIPVEYTRANPDLDFVATRFGTMDTTLPLYGTGDDYGDGLPGAPSFLDMNLPPSHSTDWSSPGITSGRVKPWRSDRPPVFRFAGVSVGRNFQEGTVVMIVEADRYGWIVNTKVISEEPKGHGLARALSSAICNSTYFPPIVNGEKAPYKFQLTFRFCRDCPRKPTFRVISGDLIARMAEP